MFTLYNTHLYITKYRPKKSQRLLSKGKQDQYNSEILYFLSWYIFQHIPWPQKCIFWAKVCLNIWNRSEDMQYFPIFRFFGGHFENIDVTTLNIKFSALIYITFYCLNTYFGTMLFVKIVLFDTNQFIPFLVNRKWRYMGFFWHF